MSPTDPARYGVVVPVKPLAVAKSRLSPLGDEVRRDLVAAFAADTVTAALGAELVSVVLVATDDHVFARSLRDLGAHVVPDGAADDLNASLEQAAAELDRRWPGLRLAALCADLPALRSAELDVVLRAAPGDRQSFVTDAEEIGTTMVLAPDLARFRPRFGQGSRRLHADDGGQEIFLDGVESLRRDVDTRADLAAAVGLGVGVRTSMVLARLSL